MKLWAETLFIDMLKLDAQFASPGTDPLAFESIYFLCIYLDIEPERLSDLLY